MIVYTTYCNFFSTLGLCTKKFCRLEDRNHSICPNDVAKINVLTLLIYNLGRFISPFAQPQLLPIAKCKSQLLLITFNHLQLLSSAPYCFQLLTAHIILQTLIQLPQNHLQLITTVDY